MCASCCDASPKSPLFRFKVAIATCRAKATWPEPNPMEFGVVTRQCSIAARSRNCMVHPVGGFTSSLFGATGVQMRGSCTDDCVGKLKSLSTQLADISMEYLAEDNRTG